MEKEQQGRSQVSVGMDDELREQLEAAAKRAVRSLSAEITWRLLRSFESDCPAGQKAA
jgi:TraY domain